MTRIAACCAAAAVVLAATAGPARADFIAATEVAGPTGSDTDIAVLDAATGARRVLPAGTDTTADELHPSLSADGSRLVFARLYPAGQRRIVVLDADGRSADLFDTAGAAQEQPGWPYLRPDGSAVLTGRAWGSGTPRVTVLSTSLAAFPAGPLPHKVVDFNSGIYGTGKVVNPMASDFWYAVQLRFSDAPLQGLGVFTQGANGRFHATPIREIGPPFFDLSHPSLQPLSVQDVALAFERRVQIPGPPSFLGGGEIVYRMQPYTEADTPFPAPVNISGASATRPAFSSDGRYLGFVRTTGADSRLFVFDLLSQTLIAPEGVDLGAVPDIAATDGAVTIAVQRVFRAAAWRKQALHVMLASRAEVGLLVQRITGHRRLLGRSVPRVTPVATVRLGSRGPGSATLRWNGRVRGQRLPVGGYLVTPQALTRAGAVRDLGRPFTVRVR